MGSPGPAIAAAAVRKAYAGKQVLDGFDLEVPRGTVCALLGPNGAGKTTAVRIFTTLLRLDGGRAEVDGLDVVRRAADVRTRIGLVGQSAAVDEVLSARQNLTLFARLYHLSRGSARARTDELLLQFELADTGSKPVKQFSGGMRRRLDLAASLILAPPVLFLDEPTTGLDPQGRLEVWTAVRALVSGGTTVLLTTQYLAEADELADSIALLDGGHVVAGGSPDELKAAIGGDRVDVVVTERIRVAEAADRVAHVGAVEVDVAARRLTVAVLHRGSALGCVVRALDDAGIEIDDITLRRPSLDEVYLRLTGRTEARA